MGCEEVQEALGRWYDGELEPGAAAAVAAHLDRCVRCSETIASWRALDRVLEPAPQGEPLTDAVLLHIRRETSAGPAWWLAAAAAVLTALGLGLLGGGLAAPVTDALQTRQEQTSVALLEETFGPNAFVGLDDLIAELDFTTAGRP